MPLTAEITIDYSNKKVKFGYPGKKIGKHPSCALLLILGPPLFASLWVYLKYDKYSKIYPKFNAWLFRNLIGRFIVVVKKIDKPFFVINRHFSNVMLNYETTKDFAKYLKKIEVRKKVVSYQQFNLLGFGNKIVNRQKKVWQAKFVFSQIPKKGELKIIYL